jgi:hypothetical protein
MEQILKVGSSGGFNSIVLASVAFYREREEGESGQARIEQILQVLQLIEGP